MLFNNEIAGILLAGGNSSRLGKPKQLVSWQGKFLINHMINTIRSGGIENLHVVLGYKKSEISQKIEDRNVKLINNIYWKKGISSSIKAGINSLEKNLNGAFIFVVDQPFLNGDLIKKMVDAFRIIDVEIVAPRVNNQQCNPVLFHQKLFKELSTISGDKGGKDLLKAKCVYWVEWDDEKLLMDIDTTQDYLLAELLSG